MADPGPRARLDGVEAARGFAALLVVLRHVTTILAEPNAYGALAFGGLFAFGRAGVEFFFVLSGFIIAYVHAGDVGRPAAFAGFWRRRLLRIYPVYWIATAILGALLMVSPTRGLLERDPVHVALSLLLLPEAIEPLLGVGWSLRHEMLFYLVFSMALLNRRLGLMLLAGWAAAILAASAYRSVTGEAIADGAIGLLVLRLFNIQFFFGMLVAYLVLRVTPARRPLMPPALALACGAGLFLATGLIESFNAAVRPEQPGLTFAYAAGSALALYGLALMDRARSLRVPHLLVHLGGASYSLYLLHVTVILIVAFILRPVRPFLPLPVAFAVCVAAAVLAGVLFSRMVEWPLLQRGRLLLARRGPAMLSKS